MLRLSPKSLRCSALALCAALLIGVAGPLSAQETPDERVISAGKDDYDWNCASCHGADGKGGGSMAKMLVKPPIDLTAIAATNDGRFPFWRVYQIIAGNKPVPGHETFQMPDFWRRFRGDETAYGSLPAYVRILLLTHYIENLQEK